MFAGVHHAAAQGTTAFTYQGQLRDGGTNAYGAYTMIFKLYDACHQREPDWRRRHQHADSLQRAFFREPRFRRGQRSMATPTGSTSPSPTARRPETLWPRVQVLPSPYALFAAVAATVTNGAIRQRPTGRQRGGHHQHSERRHHLGATGLRRSRQCKSRCQRRCDNQHSRRRGHHGQIANNAVTTAQIASGAVVNRNLAANAVNATNIASGQVVKTINGIFTDNVVLSLIGILQQGANTALFPVGTNLQVSALVPNMQVFMINGTFSRPDNCHEDKSRTLGRRRRRRQRQFYQDITAAVAERVDMRSMFSTCFPAQIIRSPSESAAPTASPAPSAALATWSARREAAPGTNVVSSANGGGGIGGKTTNSMVSFGVAEATTNSIAVFAGSAGESGGSFGGGNGAPALGPLGSLGGLGGVSPDGFASGPGRNAIGPGAGGGGSSAGQIPLPAWNRRPRAGHRLLLTQAKNEFPVPMRFCSCSR